MSDHCAGCAYRPVDRVGERACPFTVLYWDFLARHRTLLGANRRMEPVLRNLDRFDPDEVADLRPRAAVLREHFDA